MCVTRYFLTHFVLLSDAIIFSIRSYLPLLINGTAAAAVAGWKLNPTKFLKTEALTLMHGAGKSAHSPSTYKVILLSFLSYIRHFSATLLMQIDRKPRRMISRAA